MTDQTDTTTSTANTWSGSNLNVGNLTINADENVAIIASDINVENNASIEAENILIGGREDTYETTNKSITQIETMSVGAKNTYNDVYLAGMAVEKASEAVGDAQKAYDDAKRQVAAGTLSSSDLEFYKYQLDTAKESEDYVQLALANSVAAAAMSTATAGFTATASTSTTTATNTQTITEGVWNGSTINVGNNASFNSDNNLTLEGSSVVAGGTLEANADNIEILAGTNTYSETSSSDSQSASASVSYSGGPSISGSVGVNTSSSDSSSKSTSYTNSSLSGGSVVSNSDSLTLKGGNIYGDSVAINTGELNIVSLQDTAQSQSESQSHGVSVNGSFKPSSGKSSLDGGGLSYSESNTESSYASVNQQSGITTGDGGYNINVTGNTNLEGGLIASTDAAETEGNNSFSTGTLTQSDLENHAEFSGEAFGIDVSINKSDSGKYGPSRSTGYGDTEFSQTATTASGINTANVVITDKAGQQALTGETTEQAIVNVQTDTTTETADLDSGALNNHFDQAEVEGTVNTQQAVTQAFDQNVTELKGIVNGQLSDLKDDLDKKLGSGEITEEQYNSEIKTLQNYNLLLSVASAAVTAPTDSVTGQVAAMASPVVASEIGQYFKGLAANNEDGNLNGAEEAAHVLAHGVLAAAVATAGGNDALTAGVSAAASEGAAPLLSQWLYGEENGSELTADQKETISSILSLTSTAIGASTGNTSDAIAAGQASENAVENNFLGPISEDNLRKAIEKPKEKRNIDTIMNLSYSNQRSDQLRTKYKDDRSNMSETELYELSIYTSKYYQELKSKYGEDVALKGIKTLYDDSKKWESDITNYNGFPFALDSQAKDNALDLLDYSILDYFSQDGIRDHSKVELAYQEAKGQLVLNNEEKARGEYGQEILAFSKALLVNQAAQGLLDGYVNSNADTEGEKAIDAVSKALSNLVTERFKTNTFIGDLSKDLSNDMVNQVFGSLLKGEDISISPISGAPSALLSIGVDAVKK